MRSAIDRRVLLAPALRGAGLACVSVSLPPLLAPLPALAQPGPGETPQPRRPNEER